MCDDKTKQIADRLDVAYKTARLSDGCSYDVFRQKLTAEINDLARTMSPEDAHRLREAASEGGDYITDDEPHDAADGSCCSHGIDWGCCPAGCDRDDDDDYCEFSELTPDECGPSKCDMGHCDCEPGKCPAGN